MKTHSVRTNQQGFVAIFSVLVIMGILTLLAIGFSSITRQAQTRTLNHHLNSQAFYAAESGINMASSALAQSQEVQQKTECKSGGSFEYMIDDANNIAISCILIDDRAPNLEFSNVPVVGAGDPIASYLEAADGSRINRLRFDWDAELDSDQIRSRTNADFVPGNMWGSDVGIMRVDLVPAGSTDRTATTNSSFTFYLYPSTSGTSSFTATSGQAGQGVTMVTRCNSTNGYRCSASVALSGSSYSSYYVRLQAYYNPVRARISSVDSSGREITLKDGQVVIDVTGQANDVFRRVQVRVPARPSAAYNTGMHDVFAIFSGDSICKRYLGIPGGTILSPPSGVSDPACAF